MMSLAHPLCTGNVSRVFYWPVSSSVHVHHQFDWGLIFFVLHQASLQEILILCFYLLRGDDGFVFLFVEIFSCKLDNF